jgi:uncharacterized alpha-E superfamily protein
MYLVQERIPLSTAPCFIKGKLEPRPLVMRCFLAAIDKTFEVMPGSLARASARAGAFAVTSQEGGISKDTWIIASETVEAEEPIEIVTPKARVHRQTSPLPGYAAENLFWLGRYQERLEAQARLWRQSLYLLGQEESDQDFWPEGLERLLLSHQPGLDFSEVGVEAALLTSLTARADLGTPAFNLAALRRSARVVRELLSNDAWLSLHAWQEEEHEGHESFELNGLILPMDAGLALTYLDRLIVSLAGFTGLVSESMTQGPVRRFLQLGRRLERAQVTCRSLAASIRSGQELEKGFMRGLLAIHDSSITYRNRYSSELSTTALVDILLSDESNPRSVLSPLLSMLEDLSELPRVVSDKPLEVENMARVAITGIKAFDVNAQEGVTSPSGNEAFEHLLKQVEIQLGQISDRLALDYFRHRPLTQTLKEWS